MDPLTQGLLGAVVPACVAGRPNLRKAALAGGIAGMAPDLDVLIRSSQDPLLFLDYHRHFTHSLFFIPIGALVVALPFFWLWRRTHPFRLVYLYTILGYATHGLLDSCTSYGTQLLWPFSSMRVAWDNVAVVDFFLTVPLGLLLVWACIRRRAVLARIGLGFVMVYLLFGVAQRERAKAVAAHVAASRGHMPHRLVVKPTLGNVWLWRVIYEANGMFYVDAVWTLPGADPVWYPGSSVPKLSLSRDLAGLNLGSGQARDLERFRQFSDDFLALHPDDPMVVGDVRYALLPNDVHPLWGIRFQDDPEAGHVGFENFRDVDDQTWEVFLKMFRGAPL